MNRKHFLREGLRGFGAIVALPATFLSCTKDNSSGNDSGNCSLSPAETEGPFPNLTPAQLVRQSIISDRTGVALLMTYTVQDRSNGCTPLPGVMVDVWQCDRSGNYSQYGNFTSANFLRGRQTTDANGQVSFISIFPGWYPGRAPHIHLEVLSASGNSLLVTQVAFPVATYTEVYATSGYNGSPDTSNSRDFIFSDSLSANMADSITGNTTDGYTLLKNIIVS